MPRRSFARQRCFCPPWGRLRPLGSGGVWWDAGGYAFLMAVEDHGAGTQFVRLVSWPRCSPGAAAFTLLFTALTIGAAIDQARPAAIDFPKMFRAPLGRLGTPERFTVARHQHRDLTGRLSKMQQGAVHFRL